MHDRLQREKDFHNKRFEKETRISLDKFYSIGVLIDGCFKKKLITECRNKKVLEYGCGLGSYSFELSSVAEEVHSIDISEIAIEKANRAAAEKGIKNINFKVMNAESLDFSSDSFDVICGISILHHLDLKQSYSELSRVLKTDGKAFFIEPLGHNLLINLFRKFTSNLRTEDEHPLHTEDLELLRQYFNGVEINYYYLLSMLAVPFRNRKSFKTILNFLNSLDQRLFRINFMKQQAWQTLIGLSYPKK